MATLLKNFDGNNDFMAMVNKYYCSLRIRYNRVGLYLVERVQIGIFALKA